MVDIQRSSSKLQLFEEFKEGDLVCVHMHKDRSHTGWQAKLWLTRN